MARLLACCLLGAAVTCGVTSPAQACWIGSGVQISFGGTASPSPPGPTWSGAVGIDFGEVLVTEGTGVFDGLEGLAAPHTDFTFRPSLHPDPVSPLWTVGDFSFTLTSGRVVFQRPDLLFLVGKGFITHPGRRARRMHWEFFALQVGGVSRFQSQSYTVSEPTSLGLLLLGLLGAGAAWHRRVLGPTGRAAR